MKTELNEDDIKRKAMILNEHNWSDTKIAELAAEFCYQPYSENNKKELAAKWLIEYLTLPNDNYYYTVPDMKKLIIEAITQKQWRD